MFGSKTSRGCTGLAHMRANLPASCQLTKQDYELADFKIDLLWCISITSHHRLAMVVWHRLQRSSRGTLLFRCLVTSSTASTVRKRLFGRGKSAFHVVLDGTSDFSLPDQGYAGTKPGVHRHQTRGTQAPNKGYTGTRPRVRGHASLSKQPPSGRQCICQRDFSHHSPRSAFFMSINWPRKERTKPSVVEPDMYSLHRFLLLPSKTRPSPAISIDTS